MSKKTVLFLCTHNSSRSQMAEGLMNHYLGEKYTAYSAGTEPAGVNSFAEIAMNDIGIDISSHYSKNVDEFKDKFFEYVVTVCDSAKENCPVFLKGNNLIHKGFNDPTSFRGSDEEKLNYFKEIRDQINKWIQKSFE